MKSPARLLLFVLLAHGIAQVAAMPASGTKHLTKTNHDDHTEAQNSPTGGFGGMTNHATATGTMGGTGTGTLSATAPATTTTAGGMPIYHGTKTPAKPRKRFSGGIIAAMVIGAIVVVIILVVLYCCCRKRHRKTKEVVVTVPGIDQSSQADCPEHKQGVDGYPASPMPIYNPPTQPASPPSCPNHGDNKSWMEYPNPVNAGSAPTAFPHPGYNVAYTA